MSEYWGYIIPGLVNGSVYSLLAVGVVLCFQTTGTFNLAFGAQAYVSAVVYYDLRTEAGWSSVPSVVVAALVVAPLLGLILDRVVFRHLRLAPVLVRLAVGIGMLTALPAVALIATGGADSERFNAPPVGLDPVHYYQWLGGSLNIDSDQITVILVSVVLLGVLGAIMRWSPLGLRMRAVVESGRLSELSGVNASRVNTSAWLISSTLAGLAGVLLAPTFTALTPIHYTLVLMASIAAVVFGRLSSIWLTVVGALVIGVAQQLIVKYVDVSGALAAGLRPSFPFLVLIGLLLFVPGLNAKTDVGDPMASVDPPRAIEGSGRGVHIDRRVGRGVVVVALVYMFGFLDNYWQGVMAEAAIMSIVFLSITLLTGMSGYISLCHAAFVGTGAFVAGQLAIEQDLSIIAGALIGGLVAAVGGALVALLALRLGGLFLALASFGFGLLCETLIFNQPWAFSTESGINPPRPMIGSIDFNDNGPFLVLALMALALAVWVVRQVANGATGRFLTALRGSETAAASIGIHATPIKLVVFTVSAGMAGAAGGLLGSLQTIANPGSFTSQTSLYWLVVVLVVGVYTIRAAVIGGLLLVLVPEVVSHLPAQYGLLQFVLFGLGVVTLAKHPEGAAELLLGAPSRWRARRLRRVQPADGVVVA